MLTKSGCQVPDLGHMSFPRSLSPSKRGAGIQGRRDGTRTAPTCHCQERSDEAISENNHEPSAMSYELKGIA